MKTLLKGMILSLGIAMVLAGTVSAGPAGPGAGPVCFSLDNFADTYVWGYDIVKGNYQVTGQDIAYPAAMNGGGAINGGDLYLSVIESFPAAAAYAVHNMQISTSTWTGYTTFTWFNFDGAPLLAYPNEPLSLVACPLAGEAPEGVPSFPK